MEIVGIQKIIPTSRLTGTNVLLVQTTSDVVQMIDGLQPTMVEWESHGGFQHNFKLFAIMIPRIRSNGWRDCRQCARDRERARYHARKGS